MASQSPDESQTDPRPTIVNTFLTLLAVAIVIAAYIVLGDKLGFHELYAGYFFAFYWIGVRGGNIAELPSIVVGAFVGLALSFALRQLIASLGLPSGPLIFLCMLVTSVFFFLRQQLKILFNDATMLFLTLGTMVHVQAHADFRNLFESLAMGVVFFCGVFLLAQQLLLRRRHQIDVSAP